MKLMLIDQLSDCHLFISFFSDFRRFKFKLKIVVFNISDNVWKKLTRYQLKYNHTLYIHKFLFASKWHVISVWHMLHSNECIYYSPYALLALLADIVPVLKASNALLRLSSVHDLVGPSFFGVSIPSLCALCHNVVDGIPYVADACKP